MYFISYKFVLNFTTTINKHQLFLKLMYKSISQPSYKYKLLKFPLDCDLDKELSPILLQLYQKNTEMEFRDHKITWKVILKEYIFINQEICYIWSTSNRGRKKWIVTNPHWENICIQSYVPIWWILDILTNNFKYASLLNRWYNRYM